MTRSNGLKRMAGMALLVGAMASSPAPARGHGGKDETRRGPDGSSERIERRNEILDLSVWISSRHLALSHLELQLSLIREREHRKAIRRRAMRHGRGSRWHGLRGWYSRRSSHWHGWR